MPLRTCPYCKVSVNVSNKYTLRSHIEIYHPTEAKKMYTSCSCPPKATASTLVSASYAQTPTSSPTPKETFPLAQESLYVHPRARNENDSHAAFFAQSFSIPPHPDSFHASSNKFFVATPGYVPSHVRDSGCGFEGPVVATYERPFKTIVSDSSLKFVMKSNEFRFNVPEMDALSRFIEQFITYS